MLDKNIWTMIPNEMFDFWLKNLDNYDNYILFMLFRYETLTKSEIQDRCKLVFSKSTVNKHIKSLLDKKLIKEVDNTYQINLAVIQITPTK